MAIDDVSVISGCTPVGNPSVFGDNVWNVYGYNGGSISDLNSLTYRGYYTDASLSTLDTRPKWAAAASPSSATGYQGCSVDINNFTFVQKRQGFPCGTYQVSVTGHDDDIRVYINGNQELEDIGYQNTFPNFWTGVLDANSTVEIRTLDGTGDSYAALTFTLIPPVADFSASATSVSQGSSVTFSDLSTEAVSWSWSFPGGTPSTSTDQNPVVTYNTLGNHNVTLTTTTACGNFDSEVKTGYITVNPQALCSGSGTFWSENFSYSDGTVQGSDLNGSPKWTLSPNNNPGFDIANNLLELTAAITGTWNSQLLIFQDYTNVSFSLGCFNR